MYPRPTPTLPSLLQTLAALGGGDARFTGPVPALRGPHPGCPGTVSHPTRADFTPRVPRLLSGQGPPGSSSTWLTAPRLPLLRRLPPGSTGSVALSARPTRLGDKGAESSPRVPKPPGGGRGSERSRAGLRFPGAPAPPRGGILGRVTAAALAEGPLRGTGSRGARQVRGAWAGPAGGRVRRRGGSGEAAGPVRAPALPAAYRGRARGEEPGLPAR